MKRQKNQGRKKLTYVISLAIVPVALTALMSCGWIRIENNRTTASDKPNIVSIRDMRFSTPESSPILTTESTWAIATETKPKATENTSRAETTTKISAAQTTKPALATEITTQKATTHATETERIPETLPGADDENDIFPEHKQTRTVSVPYETEYIYSEDDYDDVIIVITEGKNGLREICETVRFNGIRYETVKTEEVGYIPPVNKVILKGTKPVYTYKTETVTENTVEFKTEYIDDPSLYEGETSVKTRGVNGYTTNTYRITYERGEETWRETISSVAVAPTDEVVLRGTKPVYTYKTETVTENKVAFTVKYENDASMYEGQSAVRTEGRDGYTVNTYKITYTREVESSREVISSVVTAPVAKVIAVGTKKKEESFIMPFVDSSRGGNDYPVTQYFGGTNNHGGIDFAVWYGQPVTAAMSGTVIYAYNNGYFSSSDLRWTYGTFVVIDHGNGYLTYYAHLSSRAVSVGDKVTQGQTIGYSGNTGRVSPVPTAANKYAGTHLHFEIRKYVSGSYVKVNPKNYLPWWN